MNGYAAEAAAAAAAARTEEEADLAIKKARSAAEYYNSYSYGGNYGAVAGQPTFRIEDIFQRMYMDAKYAGYAGA